MGGIKRINLFFLRSFSFFVAKQRKKTNQKKETVLSKDTVNDFIGDFSATSCCKNHLKIKLCLIKLTSGLRPEPRLKQKNFILVPVFT
jgi:hypothetical protein